MGWPSARPRRSSASDEMGDQGIPPSRQRCRILLRSGEIAAAALKSKRN